MQEHIKGQRNVTIIAIMFGFISCETLVGFQHLNREMLQYFFNSNTDHRDRFALPQVRQMYSQLNKSKKNTR